MLNFTRPAEAATGGVLSKNMFLTISQNLQENNCARDLQLYVKRGSDIGVSRSNHQRCSVKKGVLRNFAKFTGKHLCQSLFKNIFFMVDLRATASDCGTKSCLKPWHNYYRGGILLRKSVFLPIDFNVSCFHLILNGKIKTRSSLEALLISIFDI